MGLLPFLFIPFEIVLFFRISGAFGFFAALAMYWLPCILGMLLIQFQSRTAMLQMQERLKRGERSAGVLGMGANFFAGLMLLLPFFTTRVIALALLLPGVRQLVLLVARGWLMKKLANGSFVFMGRGMPGAQGGGPGGNFGGGRGPFGGAGAFGDDFGPRVERDATVIDVEAVQLNGGELGAPKNTE